MYAERLGADRAAGLNPFSTLAAEGVMLAFGSDAPVTPLTRGRASARPPTTGPRARGCPRARRSPPTPGPGTAPPGVNDGVTGSLVPGAPAHYAIWDATDLVVATPDSRVQRWSTDPRAGVPPLPRLETGRALPRCLRTVRAGEVVYDDISRAPRVITCGSHRGGPRTGRPAQTRPYPAVPAAVAAAAGRARWCPDSPIT